MKWIGLTGGIASGKSTVSSILRELGFPVIDADQLARIAVAPGTPGLKAIVDRFGSEILTETGELDRKRLAKIVFANEEERRNLENILHPRIQELRAEERRRLEPLPISMAFYDVPLLFEKNMEDEFDSTVLVYCPPEEQIRRLKLRDHLSEDQARARLDSQWPIDEKIKRAKYVIFNQNSLADLKSNVMSVVHDLQKV